MRQMEEALEGGCRAASEAMRSAGPRRPGGSSPGSLRGPRARWVLALQAVQGGRGSKGRLQPSRHAGHAARCDTPCMCAEVRGRRHTCSSSPRPGWPEGPRPHLQPRSRPLRQGHGRPSVGSWQVLVGKGFPLSSPPALAAHSSSGNTGYEQAP